MLKKMDYNRQMALDYATRWARGRNPRYLSFDNIGGDCTNFCSQCLFAGCNVMNYTPIFGWFYNNSTDRTASWTGVEYLYKFLISNQGIGPYATEITMEQVQVGDLIQLGNHNRYYHSLFVTQTGQIPKEDNILVATHTFDTLNRVLNSYAYHKLRFLHIEAVRKEA